MKRPAFVIATVLLAHSFLWSQQQPATIPSDDVRLDRGTIVNNIYTNPCFGLSFSVPQGWEISNLPGFSSGRALHLPGAGLGLLIVSRHREKLFGDQIVLNANDSSKNPTLTTQNYVDNAVRWNVNTNPQNREIIRDAFAVEYGGKQFYRADYKQTLKSDSALYIAFVYTKFGEYFVGATLTAISPETLNEAAASLRGISFQRDSPNPTCVVGPNDGPLTGIIGSVVSGSAGLGTATRVRVTHTVSEGLLIKRVPPEYPEAARQAHIEGSVVLDVTVDANGDVETAIVISGPPELTASAIASVKQWKFQPYKLNGRPVKMETQASVAFQLSPN